MGAALERRENNYSKGHRRCPVLCGDSCTIPDFCLTPFASEVDALSLCTWPYSSRYHPPLTSLSVSLRPVSMYICLASTSPSNLSPCRLVVPPVLVFLPFPLRSPPLTRFLSLLLAVPLYCLLVPHSLSGIVFCPLFFPSHLSPPSLSLSCRLTFATLHHSLPLFVSVLRHTQRVVATQSATTHPDALRGSCTAQDVLDAVSRCASC